MVDNGEIITKYLELVIVELSYIVRDYYHWDFESTYNVFPSKSPGVLLDDFGE